ncbi:MAG: metallopeptidase family protein [Candidatus Saccharibacteria bacterium]|nr:metallopeptidase family protein [Pseudorhodobacter sp.]
MTQMPLDAIAPDAALIRHLAEAAIATLPEPYRAAAGLIALRIEDVADPEILVALDIDDPLELTGLYDGVPLTEKSVSDQMLQPDQIFLFRLPILTEWIERGDVSLAELVTHVFIHELAHHVGWTDDDIAHIDPWWE